MNNWKLPHIIADDELDTRGKPRRDTYAHRKNKSYRHKWTNAHQTKEERKAKYEALRAKGLTSKVARALRDVHEAVLVRDGIL